MKRLLLLNLFLLLHEFSFGQLLGADRADYLNGNRYRYARDGRITSSNKPINTISNGKLQGDGYLVYKRDTVRGLITLSKKDVTLEKPIDSKHNFMMKRDIDDPHLHNIVMYNEDKKPLCLARIKKNDKQMFRVIHEGKLNIYDDRFNYVYNPEDVDKNLIIIAYDDVIDDLSSFLTENTKRDLIGYVNDIYGLKIEPKTISWKELLVKIDMLD